MPTYHSLDELQSFIESRDVPRWLSEISLDALGKMENMQWPSTDDEVWRRTNLSYLDYGAYRLEMMHTTHSVNLPSFLAEEGVIFTRLGRDSEFPALKQKLQDMLCESLAAAEHKIAVWHFASITDLYFIYLPKGVQVDDILVLSLNEDHDATAYVPHFLIICEENSRVNILLETQSASEGELLCNERVSLSAGNNAQCRLMTLNTLNMNSTMFSEVYANVGKDAVFEHCSALLGTMLTASSVSVRLLGEGSKAQLNGIYYSYCDQHIAMRTVQSHHAADAYSRTLYKGVIQDEAHTVYQGLIQVEPDARKTDAYLTNNNILLSNTARSDSIPSLQINNNDVRCSHGSTTANISPQQLFYLQSRGYPPEEARSMIIRAHFEDILAEYPPYYVDKIEKVFAERLIRGNVV